MLVASNPGGGYDVYARAFARFWTNHIPGHPNIIAKNMPAAAGLALASSLYNTADRDGSVIGAFTNGAAMDPLFGNPSARYDAQKFNWLGSIGKLENVCFTWHTSTVKTIAEARAREVIVGASGATSNSAIVPKMLNALIGTKFKIIAGYDTASGLTMSVERGEAEGICGLSWSTIKASRPHWIKEKLLNVIVQMGLQKLHDLPDVPSALDLVSDDESRQVLELILMRQEAGRPFALPPGVAGRSRRRLASGVRGNAEGSRIHCRRAKAAARDRAALRRRDRYAARQGLWHAEADCGARGRAGLSFGIEIGFRMLSSSAKADDPVVTDVWSNAATFAFTGWSAFADHDRC